MCAEPGANLKHERIFIRDKIQGSWHNSDPYNTVRLRKGEFLRFELVEFLIVLKREWRIKFKKSEQENFYSNPRSSREIRPPSLAHPKKWFEYFYNDNSACLSRKEVINGLVLTLKPRNDKEEILIVEVVEAYWNIFDTDYSESIDKWEFLCTDGMYYGILFCVFFL